MTIHENTLFWFNVYSKYIFLCLEVVEKTNHNAWKLSNISALKWINEILP